MPIIDETAKAAAAGDKQGLAEVLDFLVTEDAVHPLDRLRWPADPAGLGRGRAHPQPHARGVRAHRLQRTRRPSADWAAPSGC
jgi:hypothetical protein